MTIIQRCKKAKMNAQTQKFLMTIGKFYKKALPVMKTCGRIANESDWDTYVQASDTLNEYSKETRKKIESINVPVEYEDVKSLTMTALHHIEKAMYYGSLAAQGMKEGKSATAMICASLNHMNDSTRLLNAADNQIKQLLSGNTPG